MMDLKDKTIMITRQPEQAAEFAAEVEKRGGRTVLFPTIRITDPDSWDECDQALQRIHDYDGFIFTSTNAVGKFFQRCALKEIEPATFRACDIYAVGEKTKLEIERRGLQVCFVPDDFSSASLAKQFTRTAVKQKRFLFPHGNLSKSEIVERLKEQEAVVDAVIVYHTVGVEQSDLDGIWDKFIAGQIDVVTFASPSAAMNFVNMLSPGKVQQMQRLTKIAVIGSTTAKGVRDLGFKVDIVAKKSTVAGLVEAIARYFNGRQQ